MYGIRNILALPFGFAMHWTAFIFSSFHAIVPFFVTLKPLVTVYPQLQFTIRAPYGASHATTFTRHLTMLNRRSTTVGTKTEAGNSAHNGSLAAWQ
jgi:hypothetical protein